MRLTPLLVVISATALTAVLVLADDKKPGRDLSGQKLDKFDYTNDKTLVNATFERSNLRFAIFKGANCTGAIFRKADLTGASLNEATFVNADFRRATLGNASFQKSNLQGANFERAEVPCSLQDANLTKANLKGSSGYVDVTRCDFSVAEIQGADFSNAKDYAGKSADFTDALYDGNTVFPPGVDKAKSGAKKAPTDWNPDGAPEPKPEPKTEPKPMPKVDPKPDAAGGELTYGKAALGYAKEVSAADAKKLGDYFVKAVAFGESPLKVRLEKSGETWVVKIAPDKDLRENAEYADACREFAAGIAKDVLGGAKVEIHICDDAMKTLKVVTPK